MGLKMSYKSLHEAYMRLTFGPVEPQEIRVGESVYDWFRTLSHYPHHDDLWFCAAKVVLDQALGPAQALIKAGQKPPQLAKDATWDDIVQWDDILLDMSEPEGPEVKS